MPAILTVVGREEELASIVRFFDATTMPGVLVLEGEAGIGKTTLWHEGVRIGRERSYQILVSRPARSEARLAFAGLSDLLGVAIRPVLPELPVPQRRALETALLLREAESAPFDPRTIAVGFLSALRSLARERPLVLAIDDVQWLDEPSARVLAFALRRLEGARVIALFTQRVGAEDDPLHAELGRALSERSAERLRIGPLSLGALHVLLRDRLALTLPRPALQQVHTASAGNPFLALEIAQAIQRRNGPLDPREPLPVPTGVDELIGERLAALPDETLEALLVVSAMREPTPSDCSAALGDADLSSRLRPALLAHVIELEGERLRFSHPLLAAAAYSRADPLRRRVVHRRLAETAPAAEERARHLALATEAPDERVARVLEAAAASAAARGAPDAAAALLELAVALTPPGRVEHSRRRLLAARHHFHAGDVLRTREILQRLIAELPAGGLRGAAALSLAWATEDYTIVQRLCQQAIDEAGDDPAITAASHYVLSFVRLVMGDVGEAREHARVAMQLAERASDEELVAMRLAALILIDTFAGERVGEDVVTRALALEERHPEMPTHYLPSLACGVRAMYADRLDEARRLFALAERRVVERGDEYTIAAVRLHQAELEVRSGSWELAAQYAEEGLQITERLNFESRQSNLLYATARVAAHRGRIDQARAAAVHGHELATRGHDSIFAMQCLAVLGFLELSRGDAAAADRYLRPLPDRLAAEGFGEPSLCPALPEVIEALALLGEHDLARAFTARLEEQARVIDSVWARALAARSRGLITSAAGQFDQAVVHFRRSLDEELPEPFERARTQLALGSAQRRAKHRRDARATLEEALSGFRRLGAPLWAEKARAELARIGGRVPQTELTATERRVAELVAQGLSNSEVAAALVVSRRAVESNLTRIYEKLGIRSRTELARRVTAAEVVEPHT